MRWLGVRSYGICLWHWPVFMVTRPELDVPFGGLPLLALRMAITILLADLSYRFVETPIRRGVLERAWKTLRDARGPESWRLRLQWAGAVLPILASLALLGVAVAYAKPPEKPEFLAKMKAVHTTQRPEQKSSTADSPRRTYHLPRRKRAKATRPPTRRRRTTSRRRRTPEMGLPERKAQTLPTLRKRNNPALPRTTGPSAPSVTR
jgi:peptidoglycan/LPS O-acetylase OafA/YrhL